MEERIDLIHSQEKHLGEKAEKAVETHHQVQVIADAQFGKCAVLLGSGINIVIVGDCGARSQERFGVKQRSLQAFLRAHILKFLGFQLQGRLYNSHPRASARRNRRNREKAVGAAHPHHVGQAIAPGVESAPLIDRAAHSPVSEPAIADRLQLLSVIPGDVHEVALIFGGQRRSGTSHQLQGRHLNRCFAFVGKGKFCFKEVIFRERDRLGERDAVGQESARLQSAVVFAGQLIGLGQEVRISQHGQERN